MLNRFANCKSLEDLQSRFTEETRQYSNVSVDELEAIAKIFKANVDVREMPDTPLTDKGFAYILEYVDDIVTVNPVVESEVKEMEERKVNAAVEDLLAKFKEAKEHTKVQFDETKEEFVVHTDESLNIVKDAFGGILNVLDKTLGFSVLKNAILDMIDASMNGASSKKDIYKMARRCRELADIEFENLLSWGDEKSLKKAAQLKALTEDSRGKSIFESFAVTIIWISKRVFRKLNIESKSDKKSILSSICKGISTFAKVVRAGVKIVWNAAKFAASFVIAGVIIAVDWLYHAIKTAVEKLKDWSSKKLEKVQADDDVELEDDAFFDEAYDDTIE